MSSISWRTCVIGWTAPSGWGSPGSVTSAVSRSSAAPISSASSTPVRSSSAASTARRARLAALPTSPRRCGGREPIDASTVASALRRPVWATRTDSSSARSDAPAIAASASSWIAVRSGSLIGP